MNKEFKYFLLVLLSPINFLRYTIKVIGNNQNFKFNKVYRNVNFDIPHLNFFRNKKGVYVKTLLLGSSVGANIPIQKEHGFLSFVRPTENLVPLNNRLDKILQSNITFDSVVICLDHHGLYHVKSDKFLFIQHPLLSASSWFKYYYSLICWVYRLTLRPDSWKMYTYRWDDKSNQLFIDFNSGYTFVTIDLYSRSKKYIEKEFLELLQKIVFKLKACGAKKVIWAHPPSKEEKISKYDKKMIQDVGMEYVDCSKIDLIGESGFYDSVHYNVSVGEKFYEELLKILR